MQALARPLKWPPVFPLERGVVLWLPFDDRSGSRAYDRSGKANHGTLYGPTWVAGRRGSALSFDGVDDYASVVSNLLFGTGDFTVIAWAKANKLNAPQTIVGKSTLWDDDRWELRLQSTNYWGFLLYDAGILRCPSSLATVQTGVWVHLTGVREGDAIRFYINGSLQASATGVSACSFSGSNPCSVGNASFGSPEYFDGVIDEVRIYNRALNAAEVKRLYESELMLARH